MNISIGGKKGIEILSPPLKLDTRVGREDLGGGEVVIQHVDILVHTEFDPKGRVLRRFDVGSGDVEYVTEEDLLEDYVGYVLANLVAEIHKGFNERPQPDTIHVDWEPILERAAAMTLELDKHLQAGAAG